MLRLHTALIIPVIFCACGGGGKDAEAPRENSSGTPAPSDAPAQGEAAPAEGGDKPVGTKLMRDVSESKQTFAVGMGGGDPSSLGNFSLRVDDKAVWPPKGPGCDALIDCCTKLLGLSENLALPCLMATGRDKECSTAKRTVHAIAKEQGVTPPASCAP